MSIAQTCIYDTLESCKYAKYWYGKPVVSKCKDCNRNSNNYSKTQVGTVVVTLDKEIKESRAYAEMSQALSTYHGEQRSIPETDDDAGDEY